MSRRFPLDLDHLEDSVAAAHRLRDLQGYLHPGSGAWYLLMLDFQGPHLLGKICSVPKDQDRIPDFQLPGEAQNRYA